MNAHVHAHTDSTEASYGASTKTNSEHLEFADVRTAALNNLDLIIQTLLPIGKQKGDEWFALNPTRNDKNIGSFSVNTKTGLWCDYATGDKGDAIRLWAYVKRLKSDVDAIHELADFFGVRPSGSPGSGRASAEGLDFNKARRQDDPSSSEKANTERRRIVATYNYTEADGTLLYQAVRYMPKDFRQRRPDGRGGWIWDAGDRRVLYRWPDLVKFPDATVFICEGEKDADRVASLGHCATTIAGDGKWPADCVNALAGRTSSFLKTTTKLGARGRSRQQLHCMAEQPAFESYLCQVLHIRAMCRTGWTPIRTARRHLPRFV